MDHEMIQLWFIWMLEAKWHFITASVLSFLLIQRWGLGKAFLVIAPASAVCFFWYFLNAPAGVFYQPDGWVYGLVVVVNVGIAFLMSAGIFEVLRKYGGAKWRSKVSIG